MDNRQPGRRDALAFWLGMTALLLSLVPLFIAACAMTRNDWLGALLSIWVAIAVIVSPLGAILLGGASLLVKRNWRAGAAVFYATFSLLVMLAFAAVSVLGLVPDR